LEVIIMAVTPIPGAFVDNTGLEKIGAAIRQTSVGIGDFDGFAATSGDLPAAAAGNTGKTYLVGDDAKPYTSDGSQWAPGAAIDVVLGASFNVVDTVEGGEPNIVLMGVFTAKPLLGSGGVAKLYELGGSRALTSAEVDEALAAAGF
jgi:hypothetical protein